MTFPKKFAALAAGLCAALAATGATSTLVAQDSPGDAQVVVVDDIATIDWIEKSNVAALRPGVVQEMELQIGMPVAKGGRIGSLHHELAAIGVKKAKLVAASLGPLNKAKAQQSLALAVVAINKRLNARIKGSVSYEEEEKAKAELNVATASILEAEEKKAQDQAELELAEQTLDEHTIKAPFDGIVIERLKGPGESVQANEPVVKLGNLNKLRAYTYIPTELAFRVKEGDVVEIQPKLAGVRNTVLPIERKKFRGKVTFIDPEIQSVTETTSRLYAEFENPEHELRPGLKATMTIYLNSGAAAGTAVGSRAPAPAGRVGR